MLHDTPLRTQHATARRTFADAATAQHAEAHRPGAATGRPQPTDEVQYLPYGPDSDPDAGPSAQLVADFGSVELEYAALRRGAGLIDHMTRGTLRITGAERIDFLNRMLTQELGELIEGHIRRSFWLNRKGRIDADLNVIELGNEMLIDLGIHEAQPTVESLDAFLFAEDVAVTNVSDDFHHLSLHGPQALDVLRLAAGDASLALDHGRAVRLNIADVPAVAARVDQIGAPGIELIVPYNDAAKVWDALLAVGQNGQAADAGAPRRVRPVGWHAFNIARIEAGTPLFNIDFGHTNLPHESGILRERVSFTKGCYLGQEVVARMESLGKPKQVLRGLRIEDDALPVTGAQVFEGPSSDEADGGQGNLGNQIGAVTSSTLAPMLGAQPIAFAIIRTKSADLDRTVLVNAEGQPVRATIQPLRFWPPATSDSTSAAQGASP